MTTKKRQRAARKSEAAGSPVPYSPEWWAIVERGQYSTAGAFSPTVPVASQMGARAMVIEAMKLMNEIEAERSGVEAQAFFIGRDEERDSAQMLCHQFKVSPSTARSPDPRWSPV